MKSPRQAVINPLKPGWGQTHAHARLRSSESWTAEVLPSCGESTAMTPRTRSLALTRPQRGLSIQIAPGPKLPSPLRSTPKRHRRKGRQANRSSISQCDSRQHALPPSCLTARQWLAPDAPPNETLFPQPRSLALMFLSARLSPKSGDAVQNESVVLIRVILWTKMWTESLQLLCLLNQRKRLVSRRGHV